VVAAGVLGAAGVLAVDGDAGPGQGSGPVEIRTLDAKRVDAAASGTASAVARRTASAKGRRGSRVKKPEVIYLETAPQTLPGGKTGFVVGDCPRKARAMTGYYFIQDQFNGFGLENEGDSPAGRKRWAFYLDAEDLPNGVAGVTFGMVCLKNVK
jgi:hypothetical protein